MIRSLRAFVAAWAGAALLAACGGGSDPATSDDLADATRSLPNTRTMASAMDVAGMTAVMKDAQALTVLLPTDDALAPYAEEMAELQRPENRAALEDFLKAHVVDGRVFAQQLQDAARAEASVASGREAAQSAGTSFTIRNLHGELLVVTLDGNRLFINGAEVGRVDIRALNGVLHQLNAPLFRPTVASIVKRLPQTSTLEAAIRAAGLEATLRGNGPFTLFAPTNRAFERLLADLKLTPDQLLANKPLLTQVLTYHVVATRALARDLVDGQTAVTLQGQAVTFDVSGRRWHPQITLTDARQRQSRVVDADLRARNGVVHLIDQVILPSDQTLVQIAQANPAFSILVEAVVAAGLADTLSGPGPLTVFAPTDAAFGALLGELRLSKADLLANKPLLMQVLTYHVLGGKRVLAGDLKDGLAAATLNGQPIVFDLDGGARIVDARGRQAGITATNIQAANGVIHVLDRVILPTDRNLVEVAQSNPAFSILVEAVIAAGLVDALSAPEPRLTVFAPTDEAFAALLAELRVSKAQLFADRDLLTKVLTYHVVPKQVLSSGIPFGQPVTSLQGQTFTIDRTPAITDANGRKAGIVATDVAASNGVVHVIDKVILPR